MGRRQRLVVTDIPSDSEIETNNNFDAILDQILLNIKNLIRHLGSAILNFAKLTSDSKSATTKTPVYLI